MIKNTFAFFVFASLIILNFLFGILAEKKKNKSLNKFLKFINFKNILFISLLVCLIWIGANAKNNLDYLSYQLEYENGMGGSESGFLFLESIARKNNLSFDAFRLTIIIISLVFISIAIHIIGINKNVLLSLYAIFPFSFDVIQIRNFLAYSIIVLSIAFLFAQFKISKILFIIGIILATSIHSLSIVYLVLLLIDKKISKKKIVRKLYAFAIFFGIVVSLLIKYNQPFQSLVNTIFYLYRGEKAISYSTGGMQLGFLIYWFMELFFVIALFFSNKSFKNEKSSITPLKKTIQINYLADFLFWINIAMVIFFPLLIINIDFYRIYRNLVVLNYIIFIIVVYVRKIKFKTPIFFSTILAVALILYMSYSTDFKETFLFLFDF